MPRSSQTHDLPPQVIDGPGPVCTRTLLHTGVKFDLEFVHFSGANGKVLAREVVRHPGAVVVLPVLEQGDDPAIVMIRNFRLSIQSWLWELPAGTLTKGECPLACAARELKEETGFAAATLVPLGWYHLSPGMTDEKMFAYVGKGLTKGGTSLEPDEFISVHVVRKSQVLAMIRSGEIVDAKTIATILLWSSGLGVGA